MTGTVNDAVNAAVADNAVGKKWYASKTFWVNLIAASALAAQMRYGFIIDSSMQALALSGINVVLRKFTNTAIVF